MSKIRKPRVEETESFILSVERGFLSNEDGDLVRTVQEWLAEHGLDSNPWIACLLAGCLRAERKNSPLP